MEAEDIFRDRREGNSPFSVENKMLHVEGKPLRIAQHMWSSHPAGAEANWGRIERWRIPYESGHHLEISGVFKGGHPTDMAPNLVINAYHDPSGNPSPSSLVHGRVAHTFEEPYEKEPFEGAPEDRQYLGLTTAAELHRRIKEVGRLHGGSRGST